MKNTFESVIAAISCALQAKETCFAVWAYENNFLFVKGRRLAGEYRVVSSEGDIVGSADFYELCE